MQLTKEINGSIDRNSSIKEKFYHMNRSNEQWKIKQD